MPGNCIPLRCPFGYRLRAIARRCCIFKRRSPRLNILTVYSDGEAASLASRTIDPPHARSTDMVARDQSRAFHENSGRRHKRARALHCAGISINNRRRVDVNLRGRHRSGHGRTSRKKRFYRFCRHSSLCPLFANDPSRRECPSFFKIVRRH